MMQVETAPPTEAIGETSTPPEHTTGQPDTAPTAAKKPRTRKPKDAATARRRSSGPRRGREGARRGGTADELSGDDRGDGSEGLLDIARSQDASGDAVLRDPQGDHHQGHRQPFPEDRPRQVRTHRRRVIHPATLPFRRPHAGLLSLVGRALANEAVRARGAQTWAFRWPTRDRSPLGRSSTASACGGRLAERNEVV